MHIEFKLKTFNKQGKVESVKCILLKIINLHLDIEGLNNESFPNLKK